MSEVTLFSFVGSQDPKNKNDGDGPILTIIKDKESKYSQVVLFHTEDQMQTMRAANTKKEIGLSNRSISVTTVPLPISDPSMHEQIFSSLREYFSPGRFNPGDELFVSISSGTPAMHACWLQLAASGEIPANLLYVRERHLLTSPETPLVRTINPRSSEFPQIAPLLRAVDVPVVSAQKSGEAALKEGLIGESAIFQLALNQAMSFARTDYPVLILGANGTGKELFARFIHKNSHRNKKPFRAVNCAALTESLFESELFGHAKGTFTGATENKDGLFVKADGGTLFLDEVAEIPIHLQAKLLRVLQEKEVTPVGGESKSVDVRIITATNRDIFSMIGEKKFREDLLFRISALDMRLPTLIERREDMLLLIMHFLDKFNAKNRTAKSFSPSALAKLNSHNWPGNIRELEHTVNRAGVMSASDLISDESVSFLSARNQSAQPLSDLPIITEGFNVKEYLDNLKERIYLKALEQTGGKTRAARLLGVERNTVYEVLKGVINKAGE